MTATTYPLDAGVDVDAPAPSLRMRRAVEDGAAVTGRNLRGYLRTPQLLVFSSIQPVIFVLLFRYVFGGAIRVPGVPYVDFLMPGIFAQTVVFGAMATAICSNGSARCRSPARPRSPAARRPISCATCSCSS